MCIWRSENVQYVDYHSALHDCGMVYFANLIVDSSLWMSTLGVILHTWPFLLDLLIWAFSYHCSLSCLPSVINTVLCSSYPVLNLSTWCFSLKCLNSWENHVSHFHASCFWCWVFKEMREGGIQQEGIPPNSDTHNIPNIKPIMSDCERQGAQNLCQA